MQGLDRPTWFAGDLDDPWVLEIAMALPAEAVRLHCPGDLPDPWPVEASSPPAVVVIHRQVLNAVDAQGLARLKARCPRPPRVVVCVGPQARAVDVERWSRAVDVVIPEATALDTILRHAIGSPRPGARSSGGARPKVAVVSGNYELRTTLADACRAGGYAPEASSGWPDPALAIVVATVWDVPVLEPGWPSELAGRAGVAPVVALIGFADRSSVSIARRAGASACLDLPCEMADLVDALDRIGPAHAVPPAPMGLRGFKGRPVGWAERGATRQD